MQVCGAVFADYMGCGFLRQDRAAIIGTRVYTLKGQRTGEKGCGVRVSLRTLHRVSIKPYVDRDRLCCKRIQNNSEDNLEEKHRNKCNCSVLLYVCVFYNL